WSVGSSPAELLPGGSASFSLSHTVTQVDVDAGAVVNTVQVAGATPAGGTVGDDDVETIPTVPRTAAVTIEKATSSVPAEAGDPVTYDFVMTNTGNVTLSDLAFSDPLLGASTIPSSATWTGGSAATG